MKKETSVTTPFWRNTRIIPIILQVIFVVIVIAASYYLLSNALAGLKQLGIKLGFGFLENTASFSIGETLIQYSAADSYSRAFLVGLTNTLRVAIIGVILASVVGILVGIAKLSTNWLVSKIAEIYIEIFRNTPLLVQIFIWYFAVFLPLPRIENSLNLGSLFYFSNRGMAIPWFEKTSGSLIWFVFLIIGLVLAVIMWKLMIKRQVEGGKRTFPSLWSAGALLFSFLVAFVMTLEAPLNLVLPTVEGKFFVGGYTVSPEFSAILVGLVIYTSTYIAEIVRAGILGVPKGQVEAARALGVKNSTTLRLVIFPQAIRIIIPPVTSQYLNLIKNSSLAVAVGYPDLVSVGGTILNQTGRAIEVIIIMIAVYLTFSLLTSLFMNYFNKKFQLVER